MEVSAKIYQIGQTQKVSEAFSKREFIVETEEQFKQHILLQVVKDKCSVLDQYKVGDNVTVSLNLKGRLWTNKEGKEMCFNTLECWKISKVTDTPQSAVESYNAKPMITPIDEDDNSGLPF